MTSGTGTADESSPASSEPIADLPALSPSPSPARRFAVPLLLAGFALLFFRKVLAGEVFFYSDFHQTFVPARRMLGEALARGFPDWSARLRNGEPLVGNPLHSALYLPNLLFARLSAAPTLSLLAVAHVVLAATGAALLARRLGRSRAASLAAGLVFAFSGGLVSSIPVVNISIQLAWLPWWIAAAHFAMTGRGRPLRRALPLAAVVVLELSIGEPFGILAGLLGTGILLLFGPLPSRGPEDSRPRLRRRRDAILTTAAAGLAGALVSAPLLVVVARTLETSVRRAGFTPEGLAIWSFHPATALAFVTPVPFGDPFLLGPGEFFARGLVPENGHLYLAGLYVGGLALALALRGTLAPDPGRRMLLVWLAACALLALGRWSPLFPLLLKLPGFGSIRFPVKWVLSAMLPLALLAARGLDALAERDDRRGSDLVSLTALLMLLAGIALGTSSFGLDRRVAGLAAPPGEPPPANLESIAAVARAGLISGAGRSALPLLLLGITVLAADRRRARGLLPAAGALLLGVDLLANASRFAPTTSRDFYSSEPAAAAALRRSDGAPGRLFVDDPDPARIGFSPPLRTTLELFAWERETLQYYSPLLYGFDLAFGPDIEACSQLDYARLRQLVLGAPPREKLMVLGAAGVTRLATFAPFDDPHAPLVASVPNRSNVPLRLHRNLLAVPRARVVPSLTGYRGDAGFIAALRSGPDDLFARTALVEESESSPARRPPPPRPDAGEGAARIVEDAGSRLVIEVDGGGGWLVVSDGFVPGWRAELDGRPTPILRADYAFRAVAIPAGRHTVVMRYRPLG